MSELRFEWDAKKNRENRRRHKVSFEEAETTFADERGLLMADPDHSDNPNSIMYFKLRYRPCHRYLVKHGLSE